MMMMMISRMEPFIVDQPISEMNDIATKLAF
jgi:hypothetical protein